MLKVLGTYFQNSQLFRRIPAPIRVKSALHPPPPPKKKNPQSTPASAAKLITKNTFHSIRDFQKALETTTAMKRHKILRKICSNCAVPNLSLRGRCISRSLHDAAKVVISRLLTRNCCGLAVVVSVIICLSMMARWRSRRFTVVATLVVVSRSLPLWDLGGSNWDTRKS